MKDWDHRGPGVWGMVRVGWAGLRRYTGLTVVLYLVQLVMSAGAGWVIFRVLSGELATRPGFDQAVDGDIVALLAAFEQFDHVFSVAASVAVATIVAYAMLSWALYGGLIATLLHHPYGRRDTAECFGRGAAGTFFPFVRLALWSAIPYGIAAAAVAIGVNLSVGDSEHLLSPWAMFEAVARGAIPGALIALAVSTAMDYARIDLARHPKLSSWRALLRGFRLCVTRLRPVVHVAGYWVAFLAITGIYVAITYDRALWGPTGAIALFVLRQLTVLARLGARIVRTGGQVELSQVLVFPPRDAPPPVQSARGG